MSSHKMTSSNKKSNQSVAKSTTAAAKAAAKAAAAEKRAAEKRDMLSPSHSIRESKKKVVELERNNFSSIIMWKSTGHWWKMCDNSALIYYYRIAPLIEREPKIHVDTDRYFNSPVGCISVNEDSLPLLEELLKSHGIQKSERSNECILSFTLPEAVPEEEIESFRLREKGVRDRTNEILGGKDIEQYLSSEITKVVSSLYSFTKRMDDHRRWFLGKDMTCRILKIHMIKNDMERGKLPKKTAAEQIADVTDELMTYCAIVLEMRMVDVYKMEGLAKHLYNIRTECNRIVNTEIKLAKKAAEAAKKSTNTKSKKEK